MYEWRRLEEELQKLEKNEFSIFDIEAGVKNRITHQRKMDFFCVLTTVSFEGRKLLVFHSMTDRNFILHCSFVEYV